MSTDFYVWAGPWLSADKFAARLHRVLDEGVAAESVFYRDGRLLDFLRFAQSTFPPLSALAAPDRKKSPWAFDPEPSEALIELNLRSASKQSSQVDILMMANSGGLLVYDPQAHKVYRPRPPIWRILLHIAKLKKLPD